jgi:flagellar motor component MotA
MKKAIGQVAGSRNLAENSRNRGLVSLETQLTRGLRTFQPQQVAFVKNVVQLVGQGKISRAMVNTVYIWALRRKPSVPYPYFEFALRALARKRGVVIP